MDIWNLEIIGYDETALNARCKSKNYQNTDARLKKNRYNR